MDTRGPQRKPWPSFDPMKFELFAWKKECVHVSLNMYCNVIRGKAINLRMAQPVEN